MIEKRVKKLFKLGTLLGIRQGYFLGRNLYELLREPYLTLKELREKKDKSQIFLISLTALSPLLVYLFLRIIYDLIKHGSLLLITGPIFKIIVGLEILILSYLSYWSLMVLGEK